MLETEIDPHELRCPSKVNKIGSNIKSSNIKRNNLVRWKIQCSTCFKCRAIYAFSALDKDQKEILQGHANVCSCQCGLPLCPKNNVEHSHLDSGSNTAETNHSVSCGDKIESQIDHVIPSCTCCGHDFISLDTPQGNLLMCKVYLEEKNSFRRGEVKLINKNLQRRLSRKCRSSVSARQQSTFTLHLRRQNHKTQST